MVATKICGLRLPSEIEAAANYGARWIGMVFYPPSPRHLQLEEARSLASFAEKNAPKLQRVALTVDADDPTLEEIIYAASPAFLQCHGSETPERIAQIKTKFGLSVIKSVRITDANDLKQAEELEEVADMMLFDSAPIDASLPGGTGHSFNWSVMQEWQGKKPWLLAGGLTPQNVKEAITASGAEAVDVSSGVESAPGTKDLTAIRDFIRAAN